MKDSLDTNRAILFVTDDNFIKGLIAQMNSAIKYFPNIRIYLVHKLSDQNLRRVEDYLHKYEEFNSKMWEHLVQQTGHVTRTNQGKLQLDFVEEDNVFYVDTDAVIKNRFKWEYPKTMTLDVKKHPLEDGIRYYEELRLLREFVLEEGGLTEREGDFTLFTDGGFFVNKDWMNSVLRPKILEVSKRYVAKELPQRWYAMEFFHAAICLLNQPVSNWKLKQALPGIHHMAEKYPHLFPYKSIDECDIVHFLSYRKPWDYDIGGYPIDGGIVWWDSYLNGPIEPFEEDRGLEKKLKELTKS